MQSLQEFIEQFREGYGGLEWDLGVVPCRAWGYYCRADKAAGVGGLLQLTLRAVLGREAICTRLKREFPSLLLREWPEMWKPQCPAENSV